MRKAGASVWDEQYCKRPVLAEFLPESTSMKIDVEGCKSFAVAIAPRSQEKTRSAIACEIDRWLLAGRRWAVAGVVARFSGLGSLLRKAQAPRLIPASREGSGVRTSPSVILCGPTARQRSSVDLGLEVR